jgi:predicted phage tail protein
MLKDVKLYGHLGRQFGKLHRLDVAGPLDAIRALSVLLPGFRQALVRHRSGYRMFVDDWAVQQKEELSLPGRHEIRIVPVIAGSSHGIGQIFMGVALVVAGIYAPELLPEMGASAGVASAVGTMAVSFGTSLVLGGLAQMLAKNPQSQKPNNSASYLFNGPVNTTEQGNPVPVLYGRLIIGSQVVSASISAYDIAIAPNAVPIPNQVTWKGQL